MKLNGKRITIPSMRLSQDDVITIREGSSKKPLFDNLDERLKTFTPPAWIKLDFDKREAKIQGMPSHEGADSLFDINAILEFYSR